MLGEARAYQPEITLTNALPTLKARGGVWTCEAVT
jgi:hypothetical protein